MTDYQAQDSSELITPINPSQNALNPLKVSPSDNCNGTKSIKTIIKSPGDNLFVVSIISIVLLMFGLAITVFYIIEIMRTREMPKYISFFSFLFCIIGYISGSLVTISIKIHIDNSTGIITITKRKTFCCFNVSLKIQINKIEQAFIKQIEHDRSCNIHHIISRLLDGHEIKVL